MSMTAPPADPGQWRVTNPGVPTVGTDDTGKAVKGRNVAYQLVSGQTGQVFVPDSVASSDAVKALINADAARLAGIANLTSG
jgi:hypothetical protein